LRNDGFYAIYRLRETRVATKPSKFNQILHIIIALFFIYVGLFLPVTGVILYAFVRPHNEKLGKILGYATLLGVIINIAIYFYQGLMAY